MGFVRDGADSSRLIPCVSNVLRVYVYSRVWVLLSQALSQGAWAMLRMLLAVYNPYLDLDMCWKY